MVTRVLADSEGTRFAASVQQQFVREAIQFRAEIEHELQRTLSAGGLNAADAATATTTVLAAVKAVLW